MKTLLSPFASWRGRTWHIILMAVLSFLAACGGDAPNQPAIELPTVAVPASVEDAVDSSGVGETADSPRTGGVQGLPPTFTPAPTAERAIIPTSELPDSTLGTPLPPTSTGDPDGRTYTVQAGDTLAEIAAKFNVSLDALAAANNITDPDRIEVGDVLIIPDS